MRDERFVVVRVVDRSVDQTAGIIVLDPETMTAPFTMRFRRAKIENVETETLTGPGLVRRRLFPDRFYQ